MARSDETRTCDAPPPLAGLAETRPGSEGPATLASPTARTLARGRSVGRYVILDPLGRGGMGVVYAAYDPELDRKIALKVLHDVDDGPLGRRRSQRLLREAQAMAQLSHPNVITVYDVGTFDGRVFLAMELVEGHTLGEWLELEPRALTEIIEVFAAAGRGLHAAHVGGLVHRDFKPDNVLVGVDGRVRVTDFGIARPPRTGSESRPGADPGDEPEAPSRSASAAGRAAPSSPSPSLAASSSGRVLDLTLTRPGALAGTPAYMSPEQFGEGALDARGDQFSFCVALWEALYGEPPFSGTTAAERALALASGVLRPAPTGAAVPGFVHAALCRGLSVEPGDRYPDMAALLAVLSQRPRRRRRWWLAAGGVAALARALELRERALGPEHAALANPLMGLARVELELGDAAASASFAERALVVRRAVDGEDETPTVPPLVLLGRARLGRGEVEQGRAALERALAICEAHECDRVWTGIASFALWQSLGPNAAERRAALLERARTDLEQSGDDGAKVREELQRALAEGKRRAPASATVEASSDDP